MERVDQVQTVKTDDHLKTKIKIDYHHENDLFTCIARLANGFEAIGQVDRNFQPGLTDEDYYGMAHHKALKYAEMHGYTFVNE